MALDLGALFGSESAFGQIVSYGVMQQVIEALLAPALSVATQDINTRTPVTPLSPADAADLVVRSYLAMGDGVAAALKSGVAPDDFALLVKASGDALDTTSLVEAYRRKIIPLDAGSADGVGLVQGIAQGRLDPKWTQVVQALGDLPLSPADAVDAVVESQITLAEGQDWAYKSGVPADVFAILVNTRGNPPSPTELAEMVRRGIIAQDGTGPDALSFQQGIAEGATKVKWTAALSKLQTTLVPQGTITTLLRDGAIDLPTALAWYQLLGYDQTAAAALAKQATAQATSQDKALAKADILTLYNDQAIDRTTAGGMLSDLGYSPQAAEEILEIQDLHIAVTNTNSAISRIKSYYLARKIDATGLVNALNSLGVPSDQQGVLKQIWDLERTTDIKLLTEAQIVDAWEYQLMSDATALGYLEALGYTPLDAWIVLSIKNKAALTSTPAPPPGPTEQ